MDLFEHQAKELFAKYGVAVPRGKVAWSPEEAEAAAAEVGGKVVVKAQVQIGGRGKAGGIQLADDLAAARRQAERIIGMDIRGHTVRRVLVEQASDIAAEFDERARKGAAELLARLYEVFVAADCMLVEVNPLVLTADGQVVALDGKVSLDDSALDRHPDLEELRDTFAVDPQEQAAKEKGLNYIKLDGYVGIIGNGAGLVMSTLDVVAQAGGKAANFLDVGGGASAETMADGLEVILSDPKVRSVLVNIFGGITRGDLVAQGILDALDRLGDKVQVPLVVRLDGTNAEEGRALLAGSPSDKVVPAATMLDAARKAVELADANTKAGA